ncbi:MAG: hypothetical protein J7M38_15160, partial [Armatimonadetes bacterium]|nr:hypothetical protein [Armatimonadota bacterium]
MKLADTIPFSTDLTAPLWHDVTARPGATPREGDVVIDASWRITCDSDAPAAANAARVLEEVLTHSFGVQPAGDDAANTIALVVDDELDDNPETHRVRVADDGIEVTGASAVGVLRGALRLVDMMRESGGPFVPAGEETRRPLFKRRIHRSPLSPFYV